MTIKSITNNSIDLLSANQTASPDGKAASPNVEYAGGQSLVQLTDKIDRVQTPPPDDLEPRTVAGFLDKVLTEQPLPEKPDTQRIALKMDFPKSADEMTVDDYKTTLLRAEYKSAGYGMMTDGQISQAETALENKDLPRRWDGFNLASLQDAQKTGKQFHTERGMLERANRGGQAVLQYQQMKVAKSLVDYKRSRAYAPEALGGFIQPSYNAGANIGNSLTEPIRAAERLVFGTGYLPEIPRMTVAERSEYWNGNGRMTINKGAEIAATLYFGGGIGGKALATQPGRIGLGIESIYNVAAGIAGKDVTQTDKQGNSRQMPSWERGLRVAGGLLGANQVIKTEVALPNSLTNKAVNKLEDIFKNNTPTIRPQGELVTPEGLRIKMNPIYRPIREADDLNTKIVTVDSNGKPSGTRFRDDYEAHIKERDFSKASQKNGVSGSHNLKDLEQYDIAVNPTLTKESIKILSRTPHPTVQGIYKIEYQMPKIDKGKPTGLWRNKSGADPFVKTVYDPKVISDAQMTQWGREAFADAVKNGFTGQNREWNGTASNGLKMLGYIDEKGTDAVRTFFPDF